MYDRGLGEVVIILDPIELCLYINKSLINSD